MCASYWNLNTKIKCFKCKKTKIWNLQTHWMGDQFWDGENMPCNQYYKKNQTIPALKNVTLELNRSNDWFISDCPNCGEWVDFGAKVNKGKVVDLFVI